MTADSPELTNDDVISGRDVGLDDRDELRRIADNQQAEREAAVFQRGDFLLAGGSRSSWKIECDALTSEDWATLAMMAVEQGLTFSGALGVPRGGLLFAEALRPYVSDGPVLIVDDVLTTGGSILRLMAEHPGSIGLVAFARGPLPGGVQALWAARAAGRADGDTELRGILDRVAEYLDNGSRPAISAAKSNIERARALLPGEGASDA